MDRAGGHPHLPALSLALEVTAIGPTSLSPGVGSCCKGSRVVLAIDRLPPSNRAGVPLFYKACRT